MCSNYLPRNNKSVADEVISNVSLRTYDDLSKEFQRIYPYAHRAVDLVRMMYNRLTLVDRMSHRDAIAKIRRDHKHLPGFSSRNIRRSLVMLVDNPNIPHRVRPQWPKSSSIENKVASELSTTKVPSGNVNQTTNQAVKSTRVQGLENEVTCFKQTLQGNLPENNKQPLDKHQNHLQQALDNNLLEFEFPIPWEQQRRYLQDIYRSGRPLEIWFNGQIDRVTGKIIAVYTGKISERKHGPAYSSPD